MTDYTVKHGDLKIKEVNRGKDSISFVATQDVDVWIGNAIHLPCDCPGCKEKDERLEQAAEKARAMFGKQVAKIERLEEKLATEIQTRNAALHWKQIEIEKLEAEIAKASDVNDYNNKVERNNKLIAQGRGEVGKKLSAILALLEQWEPAKKGGE